MSDKEIIINGEAIKPEAMQSGQDGEGYYVIIRTGDGLAGRSDWDHLRSAIGIGPEELDKTMSDENLKPCPICGKTEALDVVSNVDECCCGECAHGTAWTVVCDASTGSNKGGCGASGGYQDSPAKAVDHWNARPNAD